MNGTPVANAKQYERLKGLRAVLRSDLQISRQVSEGRPVYVIHDPVSFKTHRLDAHQYSIAIFATRECSLSDAFEDLVRRGKLAANDEHQFFELIINLYKSGLLVLPIHQGAKFYKQKRKLQALERRNRLMTLLFLRIPISNPDRFLKSTSRFANCLFSRGAFLIWVLAGLSAVGILIARAHEFAQPFNGILSPGNLPVLWAIFVVLKLWHELGHGYACKRFGGRVPEMGTILIVGNPLAYVDATAAWSFPERWKRLIVMCGGMYFESLVAIPAVFIWALAGQGAVGSIAYQVIVTASVVTLLFNANPLMKFDGYFILSELLGIPNLRSRADSQIRRTLQRWLLNISSEIKEKSRLAVLLVSYGVASTIYRAFLVFSIAMLIASRLPIVGITIGILYVSSSVVGTMRKVGAYLLTSAETAAVRHRARVIAALLFVGLPVSLAVVPVPLGIVVSGIVAAEDEHALRVDTAGSFCRAEIKPGDLVEAGRALFQLDNVSLMDELKIADRRLYEKRLNWKVARERDVIESAKIESNLQELSAYRNEIQRRVDGLRIVAPQRGRILRAHNESNQGQFLKVGETIGILVDGDPLIRVWLNQEQLKSVTLDKGNVVRFRLAGQSHRTFEGHVQAVLPAAETALSELALTCIGGGDILVDPETNRPVESLFQVEIVPHQNVLSLDSHGRRVSVSIPRVYESIGFWAYRKCLRLVNQLLLA